LNITAIEAWNAIGIDWPTGNDFGSEESNQMLGHNTTSRRV